MFKLNTYYDRRTIRGEFMSNRLGDYIWHNGEFIAWEDAKIHIMSHVIHYGSSVFDGIRVYDTHLGPAVFRLKDHIKRLKESAQIYRMDVNWNVDELCHACVDTVKKNKLGACYIRPVVFRGYGPFGVNPLNNPVETYIATWEWGAYLGADALENGVDVCFSSWGRYPAWLILTRENFRFTESRFWWSMVSGRGLAMGA